MAKLVIGNTGTPVMAAVVKVVGPSIESLSITPTTSAQVITAPSGTDGYSPVNVSAVTSSIDANIVAGNIKEGVQILGVTGSYSGGSAPAYYVEKSVVNGCLYAGSNFIDLTGVTDIGDFALYQAYATFDYVAGPSGTFSAPDLINITGLSALEACCSDCHNVTGVNFPVLATIDGENALAFCFNNAGVTSATFPSLSEINGTQAFFTCFYGCSDLTSLSFPALTSITGTDVFLDMLSETSNVTVHFPSNMQATIEALPEYADDFGGTNTTILFDLPATA